MGAKAKRTLEPPNGSALYRHVTGMRDPAQAELIHLVLQPSYVLEAGIDVFVASIPLQLELWLSSRLDHRSTLKATTAADMAPMHRHSFTRLTASKQEYKQFCFK